ncbi:hypothetical protein Daesc_000179 [Daldinia eschscholtzii]|uniref:Uncharacterized protein n=1 Tax=Daldinia eschscholtzii TaxID=292717 RepID=A0AAX6MXQ7_9PEZI
MRARIEPDVAPPFITAGAPAVATGFGAVVLPGTVAGDVTVGVSVDVVLILSEEVEAGTGVELDSSLLLLVLVVLDVSVELLAPEDDEMAIPEEVGEVLSEKLEEVLSEKLEEEDIPSVELEVEEVDLSEDLVEEMVSEELEDTLLDKLKVEDALREELGVEEDEDVPSEELKEDVLSGVDDELSGIEDAVVGKFGVFVTTPVSVLAETPLPVDAPRVVVTSPTGALPLVTGVASRESQYRSHCSHESCT